MSAPVPINFQVSIQSLVDQSLTPAWLNGFKENAKKNWANVIWPSRKTEHWKYTSLQTLQKKIAQAVKKTSVVSDDLVKASLIDIDATRLVFVDGTFNANLSSSLIPEVIRFADATAAQQEIINKHLGLVVRGEQHIFARMNDVCIDDGVLIHLEKNKLLDKPVYVVHVSTSNDLESTSVNLASHRLLIVLEQGASAQVIEHFISDVGVKNQLVNAVTEIVVGDNAQLEHYLLHLEDESLQHLGGVHVDLYQHARFNGFTLAFGAELKRIDYQVNHRGPGAELNLQGVYLPRNQQHIDYHTNIQHWVGRCTTQEVFRGIIADASKAVFNGRIYIHPDAQKTLAELSNKNLLTSNKAEINTKPELEIYADDVKCAHGATVSQLNTNALYYLKSRGISHSDAQTMMSFGFINELLQQIRNESVKHYLMPRLADLFGRSQELSELMNDEL